MIIPTVNSKGLFKFASPFDTLIPTGQEYRVLSVRHIDELVASNEKPYENIYTIVGMNESDYIDDIKKEIPIIVFGTEGNELFYVPADRITSQPTNTGYKYIERVITIPLGALPVNFNLDVVMSDINDLIRDRTGVFTTPEIINTSATVQYTEDEHYSFMAKLNNYKTVNQSFKTKYNKLLVMFNKRGELIDRFEEMFKKNVCNNQG